MKREKFYSTVGMVVFLLPGIVAAVGLIVQNALPTAWQAGRGPAWARALYNVTLVSAILAFVAPVLAGIFKQKRALQIGALLCILILGIFAALCIGGLEK